jgi:hypothetical protein
MAPRWGRRSLFTKEDSMPDAINWSLALQIPGGPKMARSGTLPVTAYDKLVVVVPKGDGSTATEVLVQPNPAAESVDLLFVCAAVCTEPLEYSLADTEPDSEDRVKLDSPQPFMGDGAVGLLGVPKSLFFYNENATEDVEVQILVGRQAVVVTP